MDDQQQCSAAAIFTCITCRVAFEDAELQRSHYKMDWHRYNVKRRVIGVSPVTAEKFLQLVTERQAQESEAAKDSSAHCAVCNKHFGTKNQFENHIQSKKHKEAEMKAQNKTKVNVQKMNAKNKELDTRKSKDAKNLALKENLQENPGSESSSDIASVPSTSIAEDEDMDMDDDSYEEWDGDALGLEECLFCPQVCSSMENNINHMSKIHSFFIPDLEFVTDLEGLMSYLGEKVGEGHICLWCNQKSKTFLTTQAVQRHMTDKGHCKMLFDGDSVFEYSDYYDYRSSYPDFDPTNDRDGSGDEEEEEEENGLDDTGYELVLPSGATIGHRTLQRYYRQNLRPDRTGQTSALTRALAQYKSLGWTGSTSIDAKKRAKDIGHVQRMKMRHHTKLGIKANKFQTHFRPQVVF